jgi:hypothetical protein
MDGRGRTGGYEGQPAAGGRSSQSTQRDSRRWEPRVRLEKPIRRNAGAKPWWILAAIGPDGPKRTGTMPLGIGCGQVQAVTERYLASAPGLCGWTLGFQRGARQQGARGSRKQTGVRGAGLMAAKSRRITARTRTIHSKCGKRGRYNWQKMAGIGFEVDSRVSK